MLARDNWVNVTRGHIYPHSQARTEAKAPLAPSRSPCERTARALRPPFAWLSESVAEGWGELPSADFNREEVSEGRARADAAVRFRRSKREHGGGNFSV